MENAIEQQNSSSSNDNTERLLPCPKKPKHNDLFKPLTFEDFILKHFRFNKDNHPSPDDLPRRAFFFNLLSQILQFHDKTLTSEDTIIFPLESLRKSADEISENLKFDIAPLWKHLYDQEILKFEKISENKQHYQIDIEKRDLFLESLSKFSKEKFDPSFFDGLTQLQNGKRLPFSIQRKFN